MKRLIQIASAIAAMLLPAAGLHAQPENVVNLTNHIEPYGFFRTSAIFDSRESKAGSEDLFYYLPLDKDINLNGMDVNYNPSFKMSAIGRKLDRSKGSSKSSKGASQSTPLARIKLSKAPRRVSRPASAFFKSNLN